MNCPGTVDGIPGNFHAASDTLLYIIRISEEVLYLKGCCFSPSLVMLCCCAAEPGSRRTGQKGRRRKQRASAAAHLPSLPVEAAVNMLLVRAGFDLLRSAAFKQRVHGHIQRKLDVLRVPEFIQSIEVKKQH